LKNALIVYNTTEIERDTKIAEIYKYKTSRSEILACLGIYTSSERKSQKKDGKSIKVSTYSYEIIPYAKSQWVDNPTIRIKT